MHRSRPLTRHGWRIFVRGKLEFDDGVIQYKVSAAMAPRVGSSDPRCTRPVTSPISRRSSNCCRSFSVRRRLLVDPALAGPDRILSSERTGTVLDRLCAGADGRSLAVRSGLLGDFQPACETATRSGIACLPDAID